MTATTMAGFTTSSFSSRVCRDTIRFVYSLWATQPTCAGVIYPSQKNPLAFLDDCMISSSGSSMVRKKMQSVARPGGIFWRLTLRVDICKNWLLCVCYINDGAIKRGLLGLWKQLTCQQWEFHRGFCKCLSHWIWTQHCAWASALTVLL